MFIPFSSLNLSRTGFGRFSQYLSLLCRIWKRVSKEQIASSELFDSIFLSTAEKISAERIKGRSSSLQMETAVRMHLMASTRVSVLSSTRIQASLEVTSTSFNFSNDSGYTEIKLNRILQVSLLLIELGSLKYRSNASKNPLLMKSYE